MDQKKLKKKFSPKLREKINLMTILKHLTGIFKKSQDYVNIHLLCLEKF